MNTNREIRWVAPLMIVLLVFILGASLIVKAVEVYGDSATKEMPETAQNAHDDAADRIHRTSSEGDGATAVKSMTQTSASHEMMNQTVTAVGTPRIATDYISIKAAEHLEAEALKEQQAKKAKKLAALEKQQKLEKQKALAQLTAEKMKTTPPKLYSLPVRNY